MSPPVVAIDDVHKAFGRVEAVRGVSFDVAEGEFLVLLGPSGSGKTTVLRIIAGFERPSGGAVRIRGRSVIDVPSYRRDIGMVFQHLALFPHLPVEGNLAFGLEMRGLGREAIRRRVADALRLVKLEGLERRMPAELSGGQQQRVALARALVTEPAVLLLDEPLGSLDRHLRVEMQTEIRRLQQSLRITAIMVTHDQEEAMTMGDRIAVLHEGRLEQIGSPSEVYAQPASRFVAGFVGEANIFRVAVSGPEADALRLQHEGGMTLLAARPPRSPGPGESVAAVVRPENVRLARQPLSTPNAFEARVLSATFVGAFTRYRLAIGTGVEIGCVVAQGDDDQPGRGRLSPGDRVFVGWHPSAVVVVRDGKG